MAASPNDRLLVRFGAQLVGQLDADASGRLGFFLVGLIDTSFIMTESEG